MLYPVWVNGIEDGRVHPADRGLAYGDGLFETVRIQQGRAVLEHEHFVRLAIGAAALALPVDPAMVRDRFRAFLSSCPAECIAKIIVTRGVSSRGYLPDPMPVPTVIFSAHPLPPTPAAHAGDGVRATICSLRLAEQPALAGHKHLNRLEQVLLRRELDVLAADEALVCDTEGWVVEGVFSNVFLVRGGELCTPRIDVAGIRGVLRAAILHEAAARGKEVTEGNFGVEDFLAADEVFFCNSVNGIWPVRTLQGREWVPGPVTRDWQAFWLARVEQA